MQYAITDIWKKLRILLDYLTTHKNVKLRYFAGNMQSHGEFDAANLILPGTRNRIAG